MADNPKDTKASAQGSSTISALVTSIWQATISNENPTKMDKNGNQSTEVVTAVNYDKLQHQEAKKSL
jgi:hypothetical protein